MSRWALLAILLASGSGCGGGDDGGGECTAGQTRACTCPGGGAGEQSCGGNGMFGACMGCPDVDAGAVPDAEPAIDAAPDAFVPSEEACDGVDNDGDGATDEWETPNNESCTVEIAAGSFMMGCDPESEADCPIDATPFHEVTLAAYEIDRTEVTQAAYKVCLDAGTCLAPTGPEGTFDPAGHPDRPVTWLNWQRALTYCSFAGKRLPTEAEWERAARGTDGRRFPWGDVDPTCELALYSDCGAGDPGAVGALPAGTSPAGALDMAGNVAEWVVDFYDATYYGSAETFIDPTGPAAGTRRVLRGGAFDMSADGMRTWARNSGLPGLANANLGFRCARAL